MKQLNPMDSIPLRGMKLQTLREIFMFTILGDMILKNPLIESCDYRMYCCSNNAS